ncbi:MAG: hypothetical protein HKN47_02725 [Pirellulaceae bacterium]|nr:hypothetical protein [Pirellulaceae bacterium]
MSKSSLRVRIAESNLGGGIESLSLRIVIHAYGGRGETGVAAGDMEKRTALARRCWDRPQKSPKNIDDIFS